MHLYPAIDLCGGKVVRLVQGDYQRRTDYGDDPAQVAASFEAAGASCLHVVDLDGARSGRMAHLDAIATICAETGLCVEVGGGIRREGVIERLLEVGAERVVIGTAALRQWDWFERLMGNPTYRGHLVLGLDARGGNLAVEGWADQTGTPAIEIARAVSDWPLAGIVYTDIATDGTMEGPALESTRAIAEATAVPVTASGGVGTLEDLGKLRKLPIAGAIVGRALYERKFTVAEALEVFEK